MTEIRPRELVILASDFDALVAWYKDVLGFKATQLVEDGFHWCSLETETGIKLGIGSAQELGITPGERANNTVVLQFEVDDLPAFFKELEAAGAKILMGPMHNPGANFWFGSFADLEGNPIWVVDKNCP